MYKQGDIVMVRYPLSDKPNKSILRPALVVSNEYSNSLDADVLACQITTHLRANKFSFLISDNNVTVPLPEKCEIRCNKIATIRVWEKLIAGKVSELKSDTLLKVLEIIKSVF